jgi:hypothetical protein
MQRPHPSAARRRIRLHPRHFAPTPVDVNHPAIAPGDEKSNWRPIRKPNKHGNSYLTFRLIHKNFQSLKAPAISAFSPLPTPLSHTKPIGQPTRTAAAFHLFHRQFAKYLQLTPFFSPEMTDFQSSDFEIGAKSSLFTLQRLKTRIANVRFSIKKVRCLIYYHGTIGYNHERSKTLKNPSFESLFDRSNFLRKGLKNPRPTEFKVTPS